MNGQNGYSIRGASNQVSYEPKKKSGNNSFSTIHGAAQHTI